MPRSTPTAATARTIVASLLFLLTLPTLAQTRPPGSDSVQPNLWVQNRLTVPRSTASCTDLRPPFVPGQVCYSTLTSSLLCHNGSSWQVCNIPGTVNLLSNSTDVDQDGSPEIFLRSPGRMFIYPPTASTLSEVSIYGQQDATRWSYCRFLGNLSCGGNFAGIPFDVISGSHTGTTLGTSGIPITLASDTTVFGNLTINGGQINAANTLLVGPLTVTGTLGVASGITAGPSTISNLTSDNHTLSNSQTGGSFRGTGGGNWLNFDVTSDATIDFWIGGNQTRTTGGSFAATYLNAGNAGVDNKIWGITANSANFLSIDALTDSYGAGSSALTINRSGTVVGNITSSNSGFFSTASGTTTGFYARNNAGIARANLVTTASTGSVGFNMDPVGNLARDANAIQIYHGGSGTLDFRIDTGLTAGVAYTPTSRMTLSPSFATFNVPADFNAGVESPLEVESGGIFAVMQGTARAVSMRGYGAAQSYLGFDLTSWGSGQTAYGAYSGGSAWIIGKSGAGLTFYGDTVPVDNVNTPYTPTSKMILSTSRLSMTNSTGLQIATVTTEPAGGCSAATRGNMYLRDNGAGVEDTFRICRKLANDTYAWATVTFQ